MLYSIMVSVMTSPIAFADTPSTGLTSQNKLLKQAEFFLFLANSVELDNKLMTPVDIADMEYPNKEDTFGDIETELSDISKAELSAEEQP